MGFVTLNMMVATVVSVVPLPCRTEAYPWGTVRRLIRASTTEVEVEAKRVGRGRKAYDVVRVSLRRSLEVTPTAVN